MGRFPTKSWLFGMMLAAACLAAPGPARAQTGSESSVGYIDSAIPRTMARFRFDASDNDNRPDRADFFYPKLSFFPNGRGPKFLETNVNSLEPSGYLEYAATDRFSGFVEASGRFLNPEHNPNESGPGDINAGFKFALFADPDLFVTFQVRTYLPTGDAGRGLGTGHVSIEPALLGFARLTDELTFEWEVRDWAPIGGTDFAGNVVRYGGGFGYDLYHTDHLRLAPVAELVGWTVLNGKESIPYAPFSLDASGNTIVNLKLGVRMIVGGRNNIYVGYGRALTGDVWYKDIFRVEYGLMF